MQIKLQIIISDNNKSIKKDVICIERENLSVETLGLTLNESKLLTSNVQKIMTEYQVLCALPSQRKCPCCGKMRSINGYNVLTYRTLFGKLHLRSPRLHECGCDSKAGTFSPLAKILNERTSPELKYLQSKWASLMTLGTTEKLLEEVFPIQTHTSSILYNTHQVATRLEKELSDERYMFIDGCPYEWAKLPIPEPALTVGIDGGYVHGREGENRKAGWFEVIVGKSMQEEKPSKRFGFVVDYDEKPKRRLYEVLKSQGLQMNQAITFLSDGGDTVRNLQLYLSPTAEHILDWFHITMRITVMQQMAKGVVIEKDDHLDLNKELDSVKWYLWHGNTFKALRNIDSLIFDLDSRFYDTKDSKGKKLLQTLEEFETYIQNNKNCIPNYGDRYRHNETISTAFVESTVNEVITKRMVKKQQMRWTKKGAHLLLQVRIQALNRELKNCFYKWYPNMIKEETSYANDSAQAAA